MKIRFYDMNEAREAAGEAPDDLDLEIRDEIHVAYDGLRDGAKLVGWYGEGAEEDGSRDGWLVVIDGDFVKHNGRNARFSDWVVIA